MRNSDGGEQQRRKREYVSRFLFCSLSSQSSLFKRNRTQGESKPKSRVINAIPIYNTGKLSHLIMNSKPICIIDEIDIHAKHEQSRSELLITPKEREVPPQAFKRSQNGK